MFYRIFVLLFLLPSCLLAEQKYQQVDGIVAVVNDDLVMRSELDAQIRQIKVQLGQRGGKLPPQEALEKQVLERLIVRRLQVNAAKQAGVNVDEGMLAQALNSLAQQNQMDLAQFRQALTRIGLNFERFKEEMREEFMIKRLHSQSVLNAINVTDREIDAYLSKEASVGDADVSYHVGRILVAVPEAAAPEQLVKAKEKAQKVVDELRKGADFQDIAAKYSSAEDALKGGDLGWRKRGELPSMFADHVPRLAKGEVSDPIRSASGLHIIKLFDRKGANRMMVDQTHVRHILIRTDEMTSDDDAKNRLNQLRERIIGGDDFATLAQAHSKDTASAVKGGDLGWVGPNDVFPVFQQEMAALQPNQVSQPFQTQMGWHLIQVLERRTHDSTDDVRRNQARAAIKKRKGDDAVEQFVRKLRDEAYVEIRLGEKAYQ